MLEKIKNNYIYLISFIFFLIILSLAPINGDDWGNYFAGSQGIIKIFSAAKDMYFSWEGRFIGRIFIYLFTYYKFMFVIITAGLLTLIVYVANKILGNVKNKTVYVVPFMLLLLLNTTSISQTYTWIAGSITYLYPTTIVLAYFYYLYRKKEFKFKNVEFIVLLVINIITPMFVENIGVAFVFGNILWLVINRKSDKKELIKFGVLTLFSIIALVAMLMSPGTALRAGGETDFYNMNFFERIIYNIPNLIGYSITRNIIVLILMTIAIIYMLRVKKIKLYKIILFSIIPILGVIQNIYLMFPFDLQNIDFNRLSEIWGVFSVDNWYFIFYWIFFIILFFYAIYYLINDEKERNFLIFLTLVGGVAVGSMLVSPTWGERVAILTEFIFLIVSLRLLKDSINPKFNKLIYGFLGILICYFIIMFSLIFVVQKDRDNYIEKQLKNTDLEQIEVYKHFVNYVWTRAPWTDYHAGTFKNYYGIDDNKSIKIVNHRFEQILYDII